jgi:hypothetical protein
MPIPWGKEARFRIRSQPERDDGYLLAPTAPGRLRRDVFERHIATRSRTEFCMGAGVEKMPGGRRSHAMNTKSSDATANAVLYEGYMPSLSSSSVKKLAAIHLWRLYPVLQRGTGRRGCVSN